MADSVATNGGGTAAAAEGDGGQEQQQQPGWGEMIKGMLWRFLIMYFIMNLFKGKQTPTAPNGTSEGGVATTTGAIQARNLFARGTVMDLYLYISEFEKMKWKDEKTGQSSTGESMENRKMLT